MNRAPEELSRSLSSPLRSFLAALLAGSLAAWTLACSAPEDPLVAISQQQARGNFEATLEPLRKLLEERREDPEVHYLYGRALTVLGQASLAEWALRKAALDPEWRVPAAMQLAVGALYAQNYETAIEQTSQVLELEPDNVEARLLRAQAYARSRRYREEALADAERVLELDPDNTDAMEPKIVSLIELERIEEARAAIEQLGAMLERLEGKSELRGWHCATTAIFAFESEEEELAAERWADCLERFPGDPSVVGPAVEYYDEKEDYARSLAVLQAALAAEPESLDYRKRLALRLRYAGRQEQAEQLLLEGTEIAKPPYKPAAFIDLAKFYQDVGDQQKAIASTARAVEASRELGLVPPQLLLEYADSLVLAGEHERALAVAEEMTVAPHQAMIRARVAQDQGRHEEALVHFEEAFRLWPDNPWARYFAARSAEVLGDADRAIEEYRYAVRIDTGATDARTRLAVIYAAEGNLGEATAILGLKAQKVPHEIPGQLLALRLAAESGESDQVQKGLEHFREMGPYLLGQALAQAAEGARRITGPAEVARMLRRNGAEGMEVQHPRRPDAFRVLLEVAHEAGQLEELEPAARRNLEAHPKISQMHEMHGLWLELRGRDPEQARAAYERAIELEPGNAGALAGLGRLAAASDLAAALGYFDRASEADPEEAEHPLAAIRTLVALGRAEEAETRLARLLEIHPYEALAAMEWVELQLARGLASDQTEALARRAVRFGGGADALDLLARVYRQRDETERAEEAEARARRLRERRAPAA